MAGVAVVAALAWLALGIFFGVRSLNRQIERFQRVGRLQRPSLTARPARPVRQRLARVAVRSPRGGKLHLEATQDGTCRDGAQVGETRHSEERIRQQRVHKTASQFYPWMAEVLRVTCRPRRTASVRASDLRNCDLTTTIRHCHRTDVLSAARPRHEEPSSSRR